MPGRGRRASRITRAMSCTPAAMEAIAKRMRLRAASRRQSRRAQALRRLFPKHTERQMPPRPERVPRTQLLTRTARLRQRRAEKARRTRQQTEVRANAPPQPPPPPAGRPWHNVKLAASRARRQPAKGLRKPSTMRHPSVPLARPPEPRPCKAPAATADSWRISAFGMRCEDLIAGCNVTASVIASSRLQHLTSARLI